ISPQNQKLLTLHPVFQDPRPMTPPLPLIPTNLYFDNVYWPGIYEHISMNEGRWVSAVKSSAVKKELTQNERTALVCILNPLMVARLPKTRWFFTFHVPFWNEKWLVQGGTTLELASPEQTAIGKDVSNSFMAVMVCQKPLGYFSSLMIHVPRAGLVIHPPGLEIYPDLRPDTYTPQPWIPSFSPAMSALYSTSLLVGLNSNLNAYVYSFPFGFTNISPSPEPSELEASSLRALIFLVLPRLALSAVIENLYWVHLEISSKLPCGIHEGKYEFSNSGHLGNTSVGIFEGFPPLVLLQASLLLCYQFYVIEQIQVIFGAEVVLPSSMLCGESELTITNVSAFVIVRRPSPIVTSNGISPNGHDSSPEKPTREVLESTRRDLIDGFNFRKQCSYITSHELSLSKYAMFTCLYDMYTLITTGSDDPSFGMGKRNFSRLIVARRSLL
nr:hypothetical protein [Tanacetum cinerariifolium]